MIIHLQDDLHPADRQIGAMTWQEKFITDLRRSQDVAVAAALNGVTIDDALAAREADSMFAMQWAIAMADKPNRLNKLDRDVLRHIDDFISAHGNSPTQQQIAGWLGQAVRGKATNQWLLRMQAIDEITVTARSTSEKPIIISWTRPWVLKALAARMAVRKVPVPARRHYSQGER